MVVKKFRWNQYEIAYLKIWGNGDQIDQIQLYGFEINDDIDPTGGEDVDQVEDPLAFALVKPGHKDSLWIDNYGNIGENEGLLNALIAGEIIASPDSWLREQSVCKLLV